MNKVIFKFGTAAEYFALEQKLNNVLYFLEDTGELYKGETAIAQSHIYKGTKLQNETDINALNRIIQDRTPIEGDVSIIQNNTNNNIVVFIRDHDEWIQIINQDDYYNKNDIDELIGTPTTSHIDDTTGDLVTVPPTGIYDKLLNDADKILPIFNGATAGLVPVCDQQNKTSYFLNGAGQWVTINHAGQYVAPDESIHLTLEDYVTYMINNYANMIWESIDN